MLPVPHTPSAEAPEHAALLVALDAGDLDGAELRRAEALATSCAGCADLLRDLAAIRVALPAVPVPSRRRDYRLTPEDAARLRPSGWRRALAWLAAPGSTVRPLATGLAALGVVGILLTAGLPGFGAGGVAVLSTAGAPMVGQPAEDAGTGTRSQDGNYAPEAAPSGVPAAAATPEPTVLPSHAPDEVPGAGLAGEASPPVPAASGERNGVGSSPDDFGGPGKAAPTAIAEGGGPSLPLVLSVVLLAVGLGLLAARALALRRTA